MKIVSKLSKSERRPFTEGEKPEDSHAYGLTDNEIESLNQRLEKPVTRYKDWDYEANNVVGHLKRYLESKGYEWESCKYYRAINEYGSSLSEEAFFFTGNGDAIGMFVGHDRKYEEDDCVLKRCPINELDKLKSSPIKTPMVYRLEGEVQGAPETKYLFCLIGPSGSGKTTCIRGSKEKLSMGELISTTTRQPRAGEINGEDYIFVDKEKFKNLEMIESDEYSGNFYGSSMDTFKEEMGPTNGAFTAVTYKGYRDLAYNVGDKYMKSIHATPKVLSVFMYAPKDILQKRMESRGDSAASISQRMDNIDSRDEYSNMTKCDYFFNTAKYNNVEDMSSHFARFIDEAIYDRTYNFDNINSTSYRLSQNNIPIKKYSVGKDDYDLSR